jgi:hypothetical protein
MKVQPRVLIVGRIAPDGTRGKMAKLTEEGLAQAGILHLRLDGGPFDDIAHKFIHGNESETVVVHFSKSHLEATMALCEQYGVPLIQAASNFSPPSAYVVKFPYIHAPNLALGMVVMLQTWDVLGGFMQQLGAKSFVAEGHQASKTSDPITAFTAADSFGVDRKNVGSLRGDTLAVAFLNVPPDDVSGFAIHCTKSVLPGMEVTTTTRIHGRTVYLEGLKALIERVVQKAPLEHGVHSVLELLS